MKRTIRVTSLPQKSTLSTELLFEANAKSLKYLNRSIMSSSILMTQPMSKADMAINECVDAALSFISYVNKDSFYHKLEDEYGVKREEIAQKFEQFHLALKKSFGDKHYAIERQIVRTLHERAKTGIYNKYDEIEAFGKVSELFMKETEMQLTKTEAHLSLYDYARQMQKLVEESKEQLKASERLATIGETAGMVGHDLRNPLQSIIGEVYLAKEALKDLPDSEQKRDLQNSIDAISEQTIYMDKIVSDLQAFVRPVEVHKQEVNLKQLIDVVLIQVNIPTNIKINRQIDESLSASADFQLLKRVLVNLVTNAAQAMPKGGELTIQAHNNGKEAAIIIKDTGTGIPDKIKPKIFTPLFTTKSKGQGFGLAVCKRVVEAQGGTISFESQEGEGTKFTVSLPA